jgi:pyruvate dehydrogenase E2 component (dihydrolipoamide acetyltransferase)
MATVMEMPKLSDTMKEGAVARWLKKEGEKVSAGAPVVEIETDKATMEFESPASGILLKILVGDGGTCALNAPIAVIGKESENWQETIDKYNAKKGGAKPAAAAGAAPAKKATPSAPAPAAKGTQPSSSTSSVAPAAVPFSGSGADVRVKASPLAKKVAADRGVSLASLTGSGPGGRVVLRDVESAGSEGAFAVSVSPAAPSVAAPMAAASGSIEKIPLTNMRKVIAQRLTESVVANPHFYLTVSINMGPLLAWRKQTLAKLPEDKKFSVNDLLIFLVSRALRKHPEINSSWQGDHIARYHFVNMAVAVSMPTGLITPVVRGSDALSLTQIAAASKDLIKRARDGKLAPEEYQGGTFTISNLGMAGIEEFTAIINPPQAAILAVGATIPTPVVNGKGEIVVEERMKVTLSSDHRVIDGAVGSEFLKTLKAYLEDPVAALFMM